MGGGPSKEEVLEDQQFMWRVQEQQNSILDKNTKLIQDFFKSVDQLVAVKGSPTEDEAKKIKEPSEEDLKKAQNSTKEERDKPNPKTEPPKTGNEQTVPYTPDPSVVCLINQASVVYRADVSQQPGALAALVDTIKGTIDDILGFQSGKDYKNDKSGARVPGPLIESVKTLFPKEAAIAAVTSGVLSVAKVLLGSMEGNVSVSSVIEKRIDFISPGLYAATYYATSQFHYTCKGLGKTKNLSYTLSAGGVYLVTSPKLIQLVASIQMYSEITDSFSRRLKESENAIAQFTGALSDSAFFGYKFGFTDVDYNNLMTKLKTEVMKDIISNFWANTKDYSNPDRTKIWNDYATGGDIQSRISSVKSAYEAAYADLKTYYNDFVLNPPNK